VASKDEIRDEKRRLRRKVAKHKGPAAWQEAAKRLPLFPPARGGLQLLRRRVFGSYSPTNWEMSPFFLNAKLRMLRWRQSLPFALDRESPLLFREWSDEPMSEDAFSMLGPPEEAPVVEPDLLIVPLVAFDRRGGRIGQGGGTYDRTITNLRSRKRVFVIGLAYACQEAEEIPLEPHDQRLDAIVTETEYIAVS